MYAQIAGADSGNAAGASSAAKGGLAVGTNAVASMATGLLVVIVLLLACAWVVRRWGFWARSSGNLPLRIVGGLTLSQRERIVVIEIDNTWLVVGVSPNGIHMLQTIDARPISTPSPATNATPGFAHNLKTSLHKRLHAAKAAASTRL